MAHYYDKEQSSPLRPEQVSFTARGRVFTATTWSGTFSRDSLDKGTEVLINYADLPVIGRVLDLGCGWGAVSLVVASVAPALELVACDVSERAVSLTRKNLQDNGLDKVFVKHSDGFEKLQGSFDCVLTNPPYAAGRQVCYRLIDESFEHLSQGGSLQLVARHKKGGAMLEKHMFEVFGNVDTLAKKGGFRVYKSVKP